MKHFTILLFLLFTSAAHGQTLKEFTLEQSVRKQWSDFYPEHTNGVSWIKGTAKYAFNSEDWQTLKSCDAKSGKITDVCNTTQLSEWTGAKFPWMNVMKWKDDHSFYTSTEGKYFLIDFVEKKATLIATMPEDADNTTLCMANNRVAYTVGDQLFFRGQKLGANDIVLNVETAIGEPTEGIVSGKAIARSEFGITNGIFWSNTGKYLGFYQKDESGVADYPLLDITTPTGSLVSIKYPMAGQTSEKSAAGIYNVASSKLLYIKPQGKEEDYVTNFSWGPGDTHFYVIEVDRGQNHAKVQKYNAETCAFEGTLIEEKNDKWVEPEHPLYFVSEHEFIYMSEKDGFMNLYLYKDDGTFVKQLTTNKWVATGIVGHDATGNVFFSGTGPNPTQNHYFKVNVATGVQTQLTQNGTHSATFSTDFKYFYDSMESHDTPNIETVCDGSGKKIRDVLKAGNPYINDGYKIGTSEIGTIKAGDGKTDLYYRLIKPSDFDPKKKYPVLVYVYGGPHAQMITDSWLDGANLWMYWMAEQDYLVFTVDNRGSGNRGFEFENVIHRNLGDAEMEDQMKGVEFLKSLPYVDGDRLAVHGWSYGGFMTTSLMLRKPGTFNCGIAGGPVTDWSYYEIMYGERYMDAPQENPEGYKKNRLMEYVGQLRGDLLLIHGTMDDVVVMQHNYALVKAFVDAGVQVDFFPYPMHKHNVGGKDRVHLMQKVLDYVIENNL